MERGLIFDRQWIMDNCPDHLKGEREHRVNPGAEHGVWLALDNLSVGETHYGSPLCFRCSVFALKHCPYFSLFRQAFGDDLQWFVITRADQYCEFDYSTALEVLEPDIRERITSGEVRAAVQRGELHLMAVGADDLPLLQRPTNATLSTLPNDDVPKFTPEQVRSGQVNI